MAYKLTKTQLLFDLYKAHECAEKHKKKKQYAIDFRKHLHSNLMALCNDLWEHTYTPLSSNCFIITDPKKREIFAAKYRDRIVHHLYYNYVHQLFENTFITDSYSCIKNKGTHYGIHRLEKHIRQESQNYAKDCYVLKMDIRGYFVHINRLKLLEISTNVLNRMKRHKATNTVNKVWEDIIDFDFIHYLNKKLILLDPTVNCIFKSKPSEWNDLPTSKSLFHTENGCGLPIGNLTSQLLSNVFLNVLDQYMKRILKCHHYGRYVDDFYVVSKDKKRLKELIPSVRDFLKEELGLELHMGKTKIINVRYGIEFLGAYIRPYRTYVSNTSLKRIKNHLWTFERSETNKHPLNSINSFLGVFSHYSSYKLRVDTFCHIHKLYNYGYFSTDMAKLIAT